MAELETGLSTVSTRFVTSVEKQFAAEVGDVMAFTEYERTLAQHLFLKIDSALKDFEVKRLKSDPSKTPYSWDHINMRKLALDAVHRVNLGLDAGIPNHIHPVPYFNNKEKKYDVDLRIGYIGKDYCRREAAVDKPVNVIYELVYSTDEFRPIKKALGNDIESYKFEIINPFARGHIIGGFGYIMYEDPRKNLLVIVTEDDFKKSEKAAKGDTFWKDHPVQMRYKTLVHRTTDKLKLDPRKVNSRSYLFVEGQEKEERVQHEINGNANGVTIDIEAKVIEEPEQPQVPEFAPDPTPTTGAISPEDVAHISGPNF
jgi:recombination protein RecT